MSYMTETCYADNYYVIRVKSTDDYLKFDSKEIRHKPDNDELDPWEVPFVDAYRFQPHDSDRPWKTAKDHLDRCPAHSRMDLEILKVTTTTIVESVDLQ